MEKELKKKQFKEVSNVFDLVSLEKDVLKFWNESKVFEKVNQKGKDRPNWVYYDGPITANGMPHYGHAITWTMKDVIPRYQTMAGNFVSRNMGWDCQGILVEYEVEKALNFQHKSDIEKMGVDKFNDACRKSVLKYRDSMVEYETRLGRWIDHNDEYSTMDPKYIESIWWSIKELYNKGLLYKGHKVVAYSTRAGMTLSSHEVADGGYDEVVDPGVTIKFKVRNTNEYFLAWTTTPWTLPGNLMLSVGKKIKYVRAEVEGQTYILAKEALERVFEGKEYKVVSEVKAEDVVGLEYEPIFPFYAGKREQGAFKVIYADHVNTDEGTGIVHLAPYGEEDFNIFLQMGIPLFDYLSETGEFTDEIPPYAGLFYKKANKKIIEDLGNAASLFAVKDYAHQMPISYRTKEPLIYKPIESWYVAIAKIKPKLLESFKETNWVPERSGKRFEEWIKNARDWSLSRRRFWGTPLPIWVNDETGKEVVVGSFKELEELSGVKITDNFDPHKPFVDDISWKDPNGGTFKRVPEVVDVWYDSGSMPFAQCHYPFEDKKLFESKYPASYISESDDQIRLWFYTMFVLGVALFDKTPFKNVVVTGMLGDDKGKKMSKSKGNYPPIEEVFNEYGSDMLRYFLLTSPITRGEFTRFSYDYLNETKKEFFNTLWNSYRYFTTYASLHGFDNTVKDVEIKDPLDIWILARMNETITKSRAFLDSYEVMYAARELGPLVSDLSNWYIRRSRDRISSGDKVSLFVLYTVLKNLTFMMAPFMPLLSESIYHDLVLGVESDSPESVHLCDYPTISEEMTESNTKLLLDMEKVRILASLGNSLRKELNIPVRQPLTSMEVSGIDELGTELLELIKDELNVKTVSIVSQVHTGDDFVSKEESGLKIALNTTISEELKVEGDARELMREIQKQRKLANVNWDAVVKVQYLDTPEFKSAVEKYEKEIKDKTLASELIPGKDFQIIQ